MSSPRYRRRFCYRLIIAANAAASGFPAILPLRIDDKSRQLPVSASVLDPSPAPRWSFGRHVSIVDRHVYNQFSSRSARDTAYLARARVRASVICVGRLFARRSSPNSVASYLRRSSLSVSRVSFLRGRDWSCECIARNRDRQFFSRSVLSFSVIDHCTSLQRSLLSLRASKSSDARVSDRYTTDA